MNYRFEVKRIITDRSHGEAIVYCNNAFVAKYIDNYELKNGNWKSNISDEKFIATAMRNFYPFIASKGM